jgi:hypothetical protein
LDGDFLAFVDQNLNWSRDAGEALVDQGEVYPDIHISGTGFSNDRFSFNSRGLCMEGAGSVTLQNSRGRSKTISIEMTGSARID